MKRFTLPYLSLLFFILGCSEPAGIPQESQRTIIDFDSIFTVEAPDPFDDQSYLTSEKSQGVFNLTGSRKGISILMSGDDHGGILKVAQHLQQDIQRVTSQSVRVIHSLDSVEGQLIIVGSADQSSLINRLMASGQVKSGDLKGKWEKFITQVIDVPFEGVEKALVIAGSDKRGTIYGMYDLSTRMGVSPWYWWADVPVKQHSEVYVKEGKYTLGEPKVKYRGIFINDEAPALAGWAQEKFGGFNHKFYERVYELILRNKGNYLWPAMWGRAIYDDDPVSPQLADLYGVVIGTSHHEPLMRAHVEWSRYGEGPWDYEKNKGTLQEFWRKGISRMGTNESIVSIGMRGDGDEAMTEGTAISLLEEIVKDQRQIIAEETGKPAAETPQMWALYKEVQAYYDKGMRVPDDVTLLLCDDNWGNIRKLPKPGDTLRSGGYGIYYHFDYVGGPRNYKWLNTTQISRVWEQMNLAYQYGAKQVWIVNVGDIKPMEFPISFFLDYAWNPELMDASEIPDYGVRWASDQFGSTHATSIAQLLHKYTQFNSRRKPELLSPETYSLVNYREFERVVREWQELVTQSDSIGNLMPEVYQSSYFQLVGFPIKACANLNELYFTVAINQQYGNQRRAATNDLAERAKELLAYDQELSNQYHEMLTGKWNHMMAQTHIGYTYWQQPETNSIPETTQVDLQESSSMGVAIEGTADWFPESKGSFTLPTFHNKTDHYYIEIFNQGLEPFSFEITPKDDLLKFSNSTGQIKDQERIEVSVDWEKVNSDQSTTSFVVTGAEESVTISVDIDKILSTASHVENNGLVVIEAADYSSKIDTEGVDWIEIPQLGLTKSSMTTALASTIDPSDNSPHLEYDIFIQNSGKVSVEVIFSPTLNFHNKKDGFKYAISIDDNPPVLVNVHKDWSFQAWEEAVRTNRIQSTSSHLIEQAGDHRLKIWLVDSGLSFQRILINTRGNIRESYLGPMSTRK
ncbi:MAG: glycosyl hydrolase 115 family protein [Marinoscillum sp.]